VRLTAHGLRRQVERKGGIDMPRGPRTYRTRTCQCGRETKRLFYTNAGKRCGDCIKREGLIKTGAPVWRSRALRLSESVDNARTAMDSESEGDLGELEDLASEMTEWRDNMSGTALESTSKFDEVSEAADTLESGVPEVESAIDTYNDALQALSSARDTLDDAPADEKEAAQEAVEQAEGDFENAKDELESALSEVESVDFPRMF